MTTVLTGPFGRAIENTVTMLAACSAFRDFVNAPTAAIADERIWKFGLPLPATSVRHAESEREHYRPFAIVGMSDRNPWRRIKDSTHSFRSEGAIRIELERSGPADRGDGPYSEANATFHNAVDAIIGGLEDLLVASTGGYLCFTSIEEVERGWELSGEVPSQLAILDLPIVGI